MPWACEGVHAAGWSCTCCEVTLPVFCGDCDVNREVGSSYNRVHRQDVQTVDAIDHVLVHTFSPLVK